jgi:regulator of protease activity HflC (stomatin/prohibitin superfamily)
MSDDISCTWDPGEVCKDCCDSLGDEGKTMCCGCWSCIILILTIVLIACSLETIDSTEMGIHYNTPQCILGTEVATEGLKGKAPFGTYILWPKTTQTQTSTLACLSKDGVQITTQIAYQYTVDEKSLHQLTLDYKTFEGWKTMMNLKARSGLRNACTMHSALEYQTRRAAVQADMLTKLKERLTQGKMGAIVTDLQLTSVDRPASYEAAVDAKENARNNIEKVKNNRAQQLTQANTNLLKVQVAANKTLASARTAAAMTTKTASAEAAIVKGRYDTQAETYKKVRDDRQLSSDALLAYISTRLLDELDTMTIGMAQPALVAYGGNLSNVRV